MEEIQGEEEPGEHRRGRRAPIGRGRRAMRAGDPVIRPVDAAGAEGLAHARHLFRSYAAEFADSIAETRCFQGFEAELAGLPGRYARPSGCLILAMEGDKPG